MYTDQINGNTASLGHKEMWERRILPDMQRAIINSMQCSQQAIDVRRCCFELYGADFMISEDDLRPWLIEINASPCMAPSTSVTIDLTAKVLEDTLKDRRTNRDCDVGEFILLYKQKTNSSGSFQRHDCNKSFSMENSEELSTLKPTANDAEKTPRNPDPHFSRNVNEDEKPTCRAYSESGSITTDPRIIQVRPPNKLYESRSILRIRDPSAKQSATPMAMKASTISFDAKSEGSEKETTHQAPTSDVRRLVNARFRRAATATSGNSS
ncbi:hypothetical protein ACTXT7_013828 [Hymenolepis weldensis]